MMQVSAQTAMMQYAQAYQRLYHRTPIDLRALDSDWVIVNGARMRADELEYLTRQLQHDYDQGIVRRKSVLNRLVAWFKQ
jgi:hypothetical protein